MDPLKFIILALSVVRITSLLVNEEGPYQIFSKLRYLSGIRDYDEVSPENIPFYIEKMGLSNEMPEILHKNELFANILSCVYCCSVWVGIMVALLSYFESLNIIWYGLSFSAITILLKERL